PSRTGGRLQRTQAESRADGRCTRTKGRIFASLSVLCDTTTGRPCGSAVVDMSKAFTKENDADDDDGDGGGLPPLPAGGKNYITPTGYARLRSELLDLMDVERPKVVEA